MRQIESSVTRVLPEGRLPDVMERFNRAVKTAARLGFTAPTLKLGARTRRRIHRSDARWYGQVEREAIPSVYGGESARPHLVEHSVVAYFAWEVEVTIEGGLPVLPGGWCLLAAVDRSCGDEPVVRASPGAPEGLRSLVRPDTQCDHCDTKRRRNTTFLLRNGMGEVKNVGSGCLTDFIGHLSCSPEAILSYLVDTSLVSDESEDEGLGGWGGRFDPHLEFLDAMTAAITCIDLHGWVSRARAASSLTLSPTSADVLYSFVLRPNLSYQTSEVRAELARMDARREAPATISEAHKISEWARGLHGSDYEANLRALAVNGVVHAFKHLGLACSAVVAYRRAHGLAISEHEASTIPLLNEYAGEIGEKLVDRRLRLVKRPRAFDSDYGTTYLCTFEDEQRRTYQWWASKHDPASEDDMAAQHERRDRRDQAWARVKDEMASRWSDPTDENADVVQKWMTARVSEILTEMEETAPPVRRTTNGSLVWDVGTWMYVNATVKKHDEFKGLRITVLTRCGWRVDPTPPKARKTRAKKGAVAEPPAAS